MFGRDEICHFKDCTNPVDRTRRLELTIDWEETEPVIFKACVTHIAKVDAQPFEFFINHEYPQLRIINAT